MSFRSRFHPLPLRDIKITDPFWSARQKTLVERTLKHEYDQLVETGRLANFRRAAGVEKGEFIGLCFNDSDVYKWLEACAYALAQGPLPEIERLVDEACGLIAAAQEKDGYLDTFFQLNHPNLKFRNLLAMHEMYCLGHLYEAAVAHYDATGSRKLLDVAVKSADLIAATFGPGKRRGYCGHEEIELALIKLARAAGRPEYAELARWMVEERGKSPSAFAPELDDEEATALSGGMHKDVLSEGPERGKYAQDHAPIREHTEVVGHAVRAMYLYMAATDLADGRNDAALETALTRAWDNLTSKRMYVTGGIGPSSHNEGFTVDYDLPNLSAYAETCASIGLTLWGRRLLQQTGSAEYADVVERALYNGSLSGISLSGDGFFYANPLESRGSHHRVPWFGCACCPPNIARVIASVSDFIAGASEDSFWIHIPAGFEASTTLNGVPTHVRVESNYPWSGKFKIVIEPSKPVEFELRLRIPGWAGDVTLDTAGTREPAEYEDGYAVLRRTWKAGDVVQAEFDLEPRWVEAHPKVLEDLGRRCLTYGPLVYCLEEHDLGAIPQRFTVDVDAEPEVTYERDLLGGVTTISVAGVIDEEGGLDDLYAEAGGFGLAPKTAKFIPYYAWCNRGPNHMQVWVRSV
jgi:hypothetical protein